jgi:hypothetical protein
VVIIIAVEGIRLVATKKPGILGTSLCERKRRGDPGTPALPVEMEDSLGRK